jgi:hypothetical protein
MTRDEIRGMIARPDSNMEGDTSPATAASGTAAPARHAGSASERPLVPSGVTERFARQRLASEGRRTYRPHLLGGVRLHYVNARRGIDEWRELALLAPAGASPSATWDEATRLDRETVFDEGPVEGFGFEELPAQAAREETMKALRRSLEDWAYRNAALKQWSCKAMKTWSEPAESESVFRVRVAQLARERRDLAVEKLRAKYAPKLRAIEKRLRTAEQRADRERSQYEQQKMQTAISLGATVLGAVFGRKMTGTRSIGRATTAARGASRMSRERADLTRAQESIETVLAERDDLERKLAAETDAIRSEHDPTVIEIEAEELRPRKADISAAEPLLLWVPMGEDASGLPRRLT